MSELAEAVVMALKEQVRLLEDRVAKMESGKSPQTRARMAQLRNVDHGDPGHVFTVDDVAQRFGLRESAAIGWCGVMARRKLLKRTGPGCYVVVR